MSVRGLTKRLSRARLRRVGGRGPDGAAWAMRIACGLSAIAFAWWGFALLRPLPEVEVESVATVPPPPEGIPDPTPIPERERRLARLTETNLFAPDRAFWTDETAVAAGEARAASEAEGEPEPEEASPTKTIAADAQAESDAFDPFRNIELTDPETLPSKTKAKVKEVQLRAVYSLDDRPRALISLATDPANPRGRSYVVGDVIGEDEWSVLAIDPPSARVVLTREGRNFVFRLYDELPQIAASPGARAGRSAPGIERRTPAEVRRALLDSGIPAEEVDELLSLALAEQDQAASADGELAGDSDQEEQEAIPQGAPEGLEQIIELMRSNPFEQQQESTEEGEGEKEAEDAPPAG